MARRRKPLLNGWIWLSEKQPDPDQTVLFTNNVRARDRFGRMSHLFLGTVFWVGKVGRGWVHCSNISGLSGVCGVEAWHPLPGNPTPPDLVACSCLPPTKPRRRKKVGKCQTV